MSKSQMWIIAAAAGAVALIAGVKHFSASPDRDETAAPPPLAQRDAKTEHGGWSVRGKSEDLPMGDDIKVQRQVEAKPAGIAPPQRGLPGAPPGGQPAVGSGDAGQPAQPNGGVGERTEPHTTIVGRPPGGTNAASTGQLNTGVAQGSPPVADAGAEAAGDVGGASANPPAGGPGGIASNGAPNPAANAQPGTNQPQPAQDQQVQATPPADVVAVGAMYDSKDTAFSIDTPAEVKDIGNIPGHGVTMMMNLAPDWTPDNQDDADFLKLGDSLALSKNVNYMRLEYTDPSGAKHSIGTNITQWQGIDPPYTVGATVNENQMALVVNGQAVARGTWEGAPYEPPPNPTLQIGCVGYPDSRPCASGSASGVMLLPPASTADLIARTKPATAKP